MPRLSWYRERNILCNQCLGRTPLRDIELRPQSARLKIPFLQDSEDSFLGIEGVVGSTCGHLQGREKGMFLKIVGHTYDYCPEP